LSDTREPKPQTRRSPDQPGRISPANAILLAISCGLVGGYLDLVFMLFKKYFWNRLRNFGSAADFPWSVPVGHVVLLVIPGLLLAVISRIRPRPISVRTTSWAFVSLALWAALLRLPLYGVSSLLLAAGLARPISVGIANHVQRPRLGWSICAGLVGLLVILAALSSGRQALRRQSALAGLPPLPSNSRNVLLIVWDTVRAADLSLYGYPRNTTPNLVRWARKGVRYDLAVAPASWTYPSHTCFFTGHWPFQLTSQWKFTLDAPVPTLAEHLASRGYETAGFSANTVNCTYESRLDRGFTHFEDYPISPWYLLGRTVVGSWLVENVLCHNDFYESKWIRLQSRNAGAISNAFLDWLRRRRQDRPFFAYLNYFDAHDPYFPPPEYEGRFGIRPRSPRDYQFLLDYGTPGLKTLQNRDIWMAKDCYDDCIAYLDDHLGRLLDTLEGQGILENTLVIITSDHGESFGEHGLYLHGVSLYLDETAVPLVILSPDAPANRVVAEPVSLRDLPATVVDQVGLSAGSPFPGHSLAAYWFLPSGKVPPKFTPVLSAHSTFSPFEPKDARSSSLRDVQMSLVARGLHYLRNGQGAEQLFDLRRDQGESLNLMDSAAGGATALVLRRMLLDVLAENPGSSEAEQAYLKPYRQGLKSIVETSPLPGEPISAIEERSNNTRR
jgi:arylsulfatase A-like enzyme